MKKVYMILAALLIGSMCFAQGRLIKMTNQSISTDRSGWIGNTALQSLDIINAGDEYAIVPNELQDISAGSVVTKVKFYADATSYAQYGATNNSYIVKVYENVTLGGDYAAYGLYDVASTGTAVYEQQVTAVDGWNEVTLTTPYTVNNNNFWIAIHANGTSAVFFGAPNASMETAYYKYFTASEQQAAQIGCNPGDSFWTIPEYCADEECTETEIDPVTLAIYVDDGAVYVPSSDFEARFFGGISNNQLTPAEASYALTSADQALTLLPFYANNGADDAVEGTVTFDITVDGQSVLPTGPISMTLDGTDTIPVGGWYNLMPEPYSYPITAQEMIDAGLSGTFDVCFTVTYTGNDPDLTNNSYCVPVTLNVVSVEENIAASVSVYPNPANDIFTVANAEGANIVVVNSLGQVVANIENAAANQTIDASNFANGTYFVKVNEEVVKINVVK